MFVLSFPPTTNTGSVTPKKKLFVFFLKKALKQRNTKKEREILGCEIWEGGEREDRRGL